MNKKLILENGVEFIGKSFGKNGDCISKLIFDTSMIGYQEILSDPSYYNQMVVMTYPLIGNYGMIEDDNESKNMHVSALIVREYNDKPSNFRYTKTLDEVLQENNIVGISEIDTRKLTRILRNEGGMKGFICDIDMGVDEAISRMNEHSEDKNVTEKVSVKKTWYSRTSNYNSNIVVVDCGGNNSLIKNLNNLCCNVIVVPYNYDYNQIIALKPDGIIISNGPGNPYDASIVIDTIKKIQNKIPLLGVGFGYLLIAIANGMDVEKLKYGHHGKNYPVLDLKTNKIEMTCQNYSYVVSKSNDEKNVFKVNVIDKTIEGICIENQMCMGVSYYPNIHCEDNAYYWLLNQIKILKKGTIS